MRLSQMFAPTLREDPADADIASHRLLLRGGFIRQVMAGVYTSMPMGLRTMRKIEAVVREEMDAAGLAGDPDADRCSPPARGGRPVATTCTATTCSSSPTATSGS